MRAVAVGLCAWTAAAAVVSAAVCVRGPVRGSAAATLSSPILSRLPRPCAPVVLALRGGDGDGDGGGARGAPRGPEDGGFAEMGRDGGEVADDGGDRDRHMRDATMEGQAGRGEPCVDWRAYRPNTEAEQRRESQLAGKVAAACARDGASPAAR